MLSASPIRHAMIAILTTFATNVTRYYNLEVLSGPTTELEPSTAWFQDVTMPILMSTDHVKRSKIEEALATAEMMDTTLAGRIVARHHLEGGELESRVFQLSARLGLTELARPWERMYLLQIARFLNSLLWQIHLVAARQRIALPHFPDYFGRFQQQDSYLRRRKAWPTED